MSDGIADPTNVPDIPEARIEAWVHVVALVPERGASDCF